MKKELIIHIQSDILLVEVSIRPKDVSCQGEIFMRRRTEKMTVTFENAPLIRALVGDFASVESRSLSAVIERTTLNSLLPKHKFMREIAQIYLYGEGGNIGKALSVLFARNSAGLNWRANYDNFLPLVQFAREQSVYCKSRLLTDDKEAITLASTHMAAQLESLVDYLKGKNADLSAKTDMDSLQKADYYNREIKLGEYFIRELREEPQFFNAVNGYSFVVDHFDDFGWSQITYRFLNDLVQIDDGWRDDPEARLELLQLMKDVSAEWDTDN
jgi:hypothetical protein